MKDDVSKIDKFLETLFELDSGDFEQLQDVLLSRDASDVESPREGETPAEAARRRSLHEKRKNIANAFFARLQENPPSMEAQNLEAISPPDRPISENKSMTLLAVNGPSHALIPGDSGLGDAIIDDFEDEDDPGELSLLPLEGNNPLLQGGIAEPPNQEEMSYDAMLGALLISEEREQESLHKLEEQKKRAEASIQAFNERESENLASFDPVPLISMSESDMITAMLPEESEDEAQHDFSTPLPASAQGSPEAAFLQQMFKERDLTAPLPKSQAPIQNMEELAKSRSFVADASEGRRVLAGPAQQQDDSGSNPLSFDSMSGVDDGVLTYRLGAGSNREEAKLVEDLSRVGRSISQTLQASGEVRNPPPVSHQNTQTLFQGTGFNEQQRPHGHLAQTNALRDSGGQPVVATNTAARMAQMQASQGTGHGGLRPQDQHGLVPMSPQSDRSQNGPSLRPQAMMQSAGPHITGSFPGMSPHANIGPYSHVHPYNTGSFPPITTGMYQMVDGVPQPLHMPPTGQGPASMASGSSQWDEPEDWNPNYGGGSRFFFVLVGIALVLFILMGSIWLGWIYNPLKGHDVKKAAAAPQTQGPARVKVLSTPEGASVFLGDIATGKKTPAVLRLASGKHTIVLHKKGFAPKTQEVEITDERNLFFQLSLDRIRPKPKRKVTIYITTSASRAKLFLNGKLTKHRTPVFLKVEPGSYAIQVRKRRYRSRVVVLKVGDKPFYHVRVPWR